MIELYYLEEADSICSNRPHASAWWERLTSRPSYAILDDYPGQREDDEQVHAVSGARIADRVAEIIQETRARLKAT